MYTKNIPVYDTGNGTGTGNSYTVENIYLDIVGAELGKPSSK